MGDTSDTHEFRELIERSSLGAPGSRRLRAQTPRSQATLAAQIAEHQERLAACQAAGDHYGAARAITTLASAYHALRSHPQGLDLARAAAQQAPATVAETQAATKQETAATRPTAQTGAAARRADAAREPDETLTTTRRQASDMRQAGGDQPRIRVFLLDDHEVVRMGLKDLLAAEPDIEVVGEAGTPESAMHRMLVLKPDVVLLDVRLPDGDVVSLCRDIRSALPGTACLMLTAYNDDQALLGAIMAGAAGYVMKQTSAAELAGAVRTVAEGRSALGPEAAHRVMAVLRDKAETNDSLAALSSQEERVLKLIGQGLTNREIAERMFLSEKTVKNYVSALLAKLGMHRRSQVAALTARARRTVISDFTTPAR